MFVGDDDDEVIAFGNMVEEGDIERAQMVGDDDVVALPLRDILTCDGDAGGEFEEKVDEEEDEFAGHEG